MEKSNEKYVKPKETYERAIKWKRKENQSKINEKPIPKLKENLKNFEGRLMKYPRKMFGNQMKMVEK